MIVRRLGPADDLAGAIALLQRFFIEEGFDTPPETIARNATAMAAIEHCAIIAAEEMAETVGVATVSMEFGIEYAWSAEMGDLYVLPEWRGRGVARLLLQGVEDYLRAKDATGYQVTVTPYAEDHHGLRRFYAALGFSNEGRQLLYKPL